MAYLAFFVFWPLGRMIWMSFTNTRMVNPNRGVFTGLRNYDRLMRDPAFFDSLSITVRYTAASVVLGVALGLMAALAIDKPFPGRAAVRCVLLFGRAVPNVAAALIWLWIFNAQSGVLNNVTASLGLGRFLWLTSTALALPSLLAVTLDAQLRTQTRAEISALHQWVGETFIYVTHDQVEAMTMATRIIVMNKGVVQPIDTPEAIYHQPANILWLALLVPRL